MTLWLVLKRMRREWRQFGVLIISICLVTAFFALGPLYSRATIESGLKYELSAAQDSSLTFISNKPYKTDAWTLVSQQLGPVYGSLIRISRAAAAFGGFAYHYGSVTDEFSPRSGNGYRVYAFSNMRQILKLIDGRWPDRLPPPDSPQRQAASEEERKNKEVGEFSKGDVEAVITRQVASTAGITIGTRLAVGERPENRVVVNIVGLVEAANAEDAIWAGNDMALNGETVGSGSNKNYNISMFVTEGAYSDWIARATKLRSSSAENNTYVWQISLNPQAINADNVGDIQSRLQTLTNKMNTDYPGLFIFNPLSKILGNYTDRVSSTERPVVLLSCAILLLMLYHLVTTVGLVLEQQTGEWSSISSRGANTWQLLLMQGLTMILLGTIGFAVGPFLALLIMEGLMRIGPLAAVMESTAQLPGIPTITFLLSAIAAIAAVLALSIPAIPAARRSLAQFKQLASRPPTHPAWSRFGLDVILILAGIGFIARLLFFVTGNLNQALSLLANNPRQLIQLILDSANQTGGLGDPLNLIGPALLLTGVALLWLRLFPALLRLVSRVLAWSNRLTGPLAVWNVERDPGHYAQLVLLLVGTLALGTASLALVATRDAGAWSQAKQQVGGAARVELDQNAQGVDWLKLPGVIAAASLTRAETEYQAGLFQTFLVGVNPADMAMAFPETADAVMPLNGQTTTRRGPTPVVMSERMAVDEGRAARDDKRPLNVGQTGKVELLLPGGKTTTLDYKIVATVRSFPTLADDQHFLIVQPSVINQLFNIGTPNQVWLEIPSRQPPPDLTAALRKMNVTFAWDRYNLILREPLPAAIAGMLYAGFWVSLILSLLDFGFYLAVTARRRSLSFAVLQALGWNIRNIWALLAVEQAALVFPAMVVGTALGVVLAYVILPFLALVGGETLKLPVRNISVLLLILLVGFGILMNGAALWLRHLNVNQVLRLGEE
jgi:ABC-type antimicrobial peptide transport system permease subunit